MSALLKEVLALTAKNEAAVWKAVEQKVLSGLPSLATAELVKITNHFGLSQKGTNELWQNLDSAAVKVFPTLNADQTVQLIEGFGEAPETYELSQQLDQLLTVSWDQLGKVALQKSLEKDPYLAANVMNAFNAGAPTWLRMLETQDYSRDLNKLDVPANGNDVDYNVVNEDGTPIRSAEERAAFVEKELEKLQKAFPNEPLLDEIRSN